MVKKTALERRQLVEKEKQLKELETIKLEQERLKMLKTHEEAIASQHLKNQQEKAEFETLKLIEQRKLEKLRAEHDKEHQANLKIQRESEESERIRKDRYKWKIKQDLIKRQNELDRQRALASAKVKLAYNKRERSLRIATQRKNDEKTRILEHIRLEKLKQEAQVEAQKELDEETMLRRQREDHIETDKLMDHYHDTLTLHDPLFDKYPNFGVEHSLTSDKSVLAEDKSGLDSKLSLGS